MTMKTTLSSIRKAAGGAALRAYGRSAPIRFSLPLILLSVVFIAGCALPGHPSGAQQSTKPGQKNELGLESLSAAAKNEPKQGQQDIPLFVRAGLPGPGHEALKPLEGTWRVEKTIYAVLGTPDNPTVSKDLVSRKTWMADGRYLKDETEGKIGSEKYWRMGLLGYSDIDKRYEWVTVDALNANMMIYQGETGMGPQTTISMSGFFTDQGLLGEENAGKQAGMRTVIKIESEDRHTIELYFTPSGEKEFLLDRSIYTREKP